MRTIFLACAASVLAAPLSGGQPADEIVWLPSLPDALASAVEEQRVVFLAINMDHDPGNNNMVLDVYPNKRIAQLSRKTLPVVGSAFTHAREGEECPRFGIITCADHQGVEKAARHTVLDSKGDAYIVAPQHLFLAPDGTVLLSVPYMVNAAELEWCFVTAIKKLDPEADVKMSAKARPPRRLVVQGVAKPRRRDVPPATAEEAAELIKQLKKGMKVEPAIKVMKRLATADDEDARDYLVSAIRANPGAGPRGRGGKDRRAELLHTIGATSPPSYWKVCAEFIDAGEDALRLESVVALEQLAAPESLGLLRKAHKKEKEPGIRHALLRALGAAGAEDEPTRELLLDVAGEDRDENMRIAALLSLGSLAPHEDVRECLTRAFEKTQGRERMAAAIAMSITRDEAWVELLETAEGQTEAEREAFKAALEVLGGAPLARLKDSLVSITGDTIPRERVFGA